MHRLRSRTNQYRDTEFAFVADGLSRSETEADTVSLLADPNADATEGTDRDPDGAAHGKSLPSKAAAVTIPATTTTTTTTSSAALDTSATTAPSASGSDALSVAASPPPTAAPNVPWYAWVSLAVACCCMAAVGPTFKYISHLGIPAILAGIWRMQTMIICLFVPFVGETTRNLWRKQAPVYKKLLCSRYLPWTIACGVGWCVSLSLWLVALTYTTTVRSSLFSSLSPLVLLGWIRFRGQRISRGEVVGVAIAMVGILVCSVGGLSGASSSSSSSSSPDDGGGGNAAGAAAGETADGDQKDGSRMLIGDGLSLLVSFVLAFGTLLGSRTRQRVPVMAFTFVSSVVALTCMVVLSLSIEGTTFSASPPNGLFAWVDPAFVLIILVFGLVVGMLGILGFNIAIRHVSPLIYSLSQLIDPVLTAFFAAISGIEGLPSAWTFVGGFVLLLGMFVVIYHEDVRKKLQQAQGQQEALLPPSDDGTANE